MRNIQEKIKSALNRILTLLFIVSAVLVLPYFLILQAEEPDPVLVEESNPVSAEPDPVLVEESNPVSAEPDPVLVEESNPVSAEPDPVLVEEPNLVFTDEQPPVLPQGFVVDKTSYGLEETIKSSGLPPKSFIEIYWLDNPETAENPDPDSRPSNVFGVLVGDDGTVNIEAAMLPPGRFVLVNTFEPEHCSNFYLSQCRARSDYLGEVLITISAP